MEFRQLEYFCTISELENFTRTAKVLHVSQPSVTKAIKALEAELGLTLIDRSQKHVTLTDAGRAFLIHARRIMQDAEIAKQDMMRFCVGSAGTVHFGVPPMFEAYLSRSSSRSSARRSRIHCSMCRNSATPMRCASTWRSAISTSA